MKILAPTAQAVTMSSREIAELAGKEHKHVVRDIEKMLIDLEIYSPDLDFNDFKGFFVNRSIYKGRNVIESIDLEQDLTMTLVMGYKVQLRHKVAKRWRELESGITSPVIKSNSGLPEYRFAKAEQLKSVALEKNIASIERLNALLPNLDHLAKQSLAASIINPTIGFEAIPLPVLEEKYYTAGEVGKMLDVSAKKIGLVANKHNLKNEQNGKFFLDKSAYSSKQVQAFRYNENGIKVLRHLIHGVEVA
ncbi:Rha family transcriptional regulator [Xenorhabdus stockiae]|uniref:Rha family transcriptional regulator n=1 Tax=Xenorhabdus stockiae TaxID=351614 RepID=UPI0040643857